MAVRTADAGKPALWVAAVQIALNDFFDDGPEEAVLLLKAALVLREKAVEIVEKHSIEDRPLGMSGTIDSGHSQSCSSRNAPALLKRALR